MKIYAISDLHLSSNCDKPMDIFGKGWDNYIENIKNDWEQKVLDDDLVILAGDFSWAMQTDDAMADFDVLKNLKGRKVLVRGNHDYWWKSIGKLRESVPEGFFLLQNDSVRFDDVIICGTRGWTIAADNSEEDNKILLREIERMKLALASAQKKRTNGENLIVATHFPPFNPQRQNGVLTELFEQNNVNAVVYGHLHGKDNAQKPFVRNNITYYLTSCDTLKQKLVRIKI